MTDKNTHFNCSIGNSKEVSFLHKSEGSCLPSPLSTRCNIPNGFSVHSEGNVMSDNLYDADTCNNKNHFGNQIPNDNFEEELNVQEKEIVDYLEKLFSVREILFGILSFTSPNNKLFLLNVLKQSVESNASKAEERFLENGYEDDNEEEDDDDYDNGNDDEIKASNTTYSSLECLPPASTRRTIYEVECTSGSSVSTFDTGDGEIEANHSFQDPLFQLQLKITAFKDTLKQLDDLLARLEELNKEELQKTVTLVRNNENRQTDFQTTESPNTEKRGFYVDTCNSQVRGTTYQNKDGSVGVLEEENGKFEGCQTSAMETMGTDNSVQREFGYVINNSGSNDHSEMEPEKPVGMNNNTRGTTALETGAQRIVVDENCQHQVMLRESMQVMNGKSNRHMSNDRQMVELESEQDENVDSQNKMEEQTGTQGNHDLEQNLPAKDSEISAVDYQEDGGNSILLNVLDELECPFKWQPDNVVSKEANARIQENMVEYLTDKEEEFRGAKRNVFREIVIHVVLSYEKAKKNHFRGAVEDLSHCYSLISHELETLQEASTTETRVEEASHDDKCLASASNEENELVVSEEGCKEDIEINIQDNTEDDHLSEHHSDVCDSEEGSKNDSENINSLNEGAAFVQDNLYYWPNENDANDCFGDCNMFQPDGSSQREPKTVVGSRNGAKSPLNLGENEEPETSDMAFKNVDASDSYKESDYSADSSAFASTSASGKDSIESDQTTADIPDMPSSETHNSNKGKHLKEHGTSQQVYKTDEAVENNDSYTLMEEASEEDIFQEELKKTKERFLALHYVIESCAAYISYIREDYNMVLEVAADCKQRYMQFGAVGKATIAALKGSVFCEYGNEGNAIGVKFLKEALQLDPNYWEWNLYCGKVLGRLRRIYKSVTAMPEQEELQLLTKAVTLHRKDASSLVHLANVYRGLASAHYRQAVAMNELPISARQQGGAMSRFPSRRQNYQSHEDYRRSHMMPKHTIRSTKSDEYLGLAKGLYLQALAMEPDCPYNNARCAKGLWSMPYPFRDKEMAQKSILHALSIAPDDSLVNHYAGLFYEFNHDHEKALTCYERATNGTKNNFPAHMSYVSLRMKMNPGSYSPLLHLDIILQKYTSPNNRIHIFCTRAFFHKIEKQPLQAIRFFCKAIEVDPHHFTLKNFHPPSLYGHSGFVCNIYEVLEETLEEFKNGRDYRKYRDFIDNVYKFLKNVKPENTD